MDCEDTKKIKDGLVTLGLGLVPSDVVGVSYSETVDVENNGTGKIVLDVLPPGAERSPLHEKPSVLGFDTGDTNRFWLVITVI